VAGRDLTADEWDDVLPERPYPSHLLARLTQADESLSAGANGFLIKDSLPERLIDALRTVAAGDSLLGPPGHASAHRGY
jgi:hypothetical protein